MTMVAAESTVMMIIDGSDSGTSSCAPGRIKRESRYSPLHLVTITKAHGGCGNKTNLSNSAATPWPCRISSKWQETV